VKKGLFKKRKEKTGRILDLQAKHAVVNDRKRGEKALTFGGWTKEEKKRMYERALE